MANTIYDLQWRNSTEIEKCATFSAIEDIFLPLLVIGVQKLSAVGSTASNADIDIHVHSSSLSKIDLVTAASEALALHSGMNRAFVIRYGSISNSSEDRHDGNVFDKDFSSNHQNPYTAKYRSQLSFGSHKILASCLAKGDSGSVRFLSRFIPESAVSIIMDCLEKKSIDIVKRLFGEMPTSYLTTTKNPGNFNNTLLRGFGSTAHLAMTVLANKLRPLRSEEVSIQSSKKIRNQTDCNDASSLETSILIGAGHSVDINLLEAAESGTFMTPSNMNNSAISSNMNSSANGDERIRDREASTPRDVTFSMYHIILIVGAIFLAECLWLLISFLQSSH